MERAEGTQSTSVMFPQRRFDNLTEFIQLLYQKDFLKMGYTRYTLLFPQKDHSFIQQNEAHFPVNFWRFVLMKPEDLNDSPQPSSQGALQFVRRPWLPEIHCNGPGSFPFSRSQRRKKLLEIFGAS